MNREQLLKEIKVYFKIQELVGKVTYRVHGEKAWKFFDDDLLECLLVVRKGLNKPITINNWNNGGSIQQRGLRTNVMAIFRKMFQRRKLYLSAHILGKAVDFDVKGMTANQVRGWIVKNEKLFPVKVRLERKLRGKYISWVHLDTIYESKNPKIYLFDV